MSRTLTADLLWDLPRLGAPVAAGGSLIVPVSTGDHSADRTITRLWWVAPDGSRRPLTASGLDATGPAVSADGDTLAFLRPVDGVKQAHVMSLNGGESQVVTRFPMSALGVRWLPDGRLVVLAPLLKGHLDLEATRDEVASRSGRTPVVHTTEDATYRFWDTWLTTGEVPHLFVVNPDTGAIDDLTPDSERWWTFPSVGSPAGQFDVSADGTRIAFSADTSSPPHAQFSWSVFVVSLSTREPIEITADRPGHARRPRFSPDGSTIVYGWQEIPDFYADRVRLVSYDVDRGHHEALTENWDRSAAEWEFAGPDLVLSAEDAGRQRLWRLTPGGNDPAPLTEGGWFSSPVPFAGGLAALRADLSTPPAVVSISAGSVTPVADFTSEALEGVDLGTVDEITVEGAEGEPIQAFLLHPPGSEPTAHLPLVHLIHGGPHGAFGDTWHWRWNAQVVAAAGYRVAMVNFHGSTGFGQNFAMSIHQRWGDQPAADIEAVTDHLVSTGLADPTRMAVTGGSYGGYLTAWITSRTSRYACAIAHAAVTNLGGMYASDVLQGRRRAMGAHVWEDRDAVDRWSPSAHADGYSTPTLVIHGEKDYRVPSTQGLELYGVLKAKGVPARLVYYPGENHWILSRSNSIHWYGEFLGWLQRYLT